MPLKKCLAQHSTRLRGGEPYLHLLLLGCSLFALVLLVARVAPALGSYDVVIGRGHLHSYKVKVWGLS